MCIRIGRRFCNSCHNLVTIDGHLLTWAYSIRYLGVYILRARSFQCSFDVARRKFYSAFNAVYGRIGRFASEEVTLNLIIAKCIPCLLNASEALSLNSAQLKSKNFSVKRVLFKIFQTAFPDIICDCQQFFNFPDVSERILKRKTNFMNGLSMNNNMFCNLLYSNSDSTIN